MCPTSEDSYFPSAPKSRESEIKQLEGQMQCLNVAVQDNPILCKIVLDQMNKVNHALTDLTKVKDDLEFLTIIRNLLQNGKEIDLPESMKEKGPIRPEQVNSMMAELARGQREMDKVNEKARNPDFKALPTVVTTKVYKVTSDLVYFVEEGKGSARIYWPKMAGLQEPSSPHKTQIGCGIDCHTIALCVRSPVSQELKQLIITVEVLQDYNAKFSKSDYHIVCDIVAK